MQDNVIVAVKNYDDRHYTCEITEFIDKYILEKWKDDYINWGSKTYLWGLEENESFKGTAFRWPGATRGYIALDKDDIITDIVFYPDTSFGTARLSQLYDRKVEEDVKVFIGKKLVFKEVQINEINKW